MARAWEVASNPAGVILFVIEDVSYNICDQVRIIIHLSVWLYYCWRMVENFF